MWKNHSEKEWNQRYEELAKFYQENKHFKVPNYDSSVLKLNQLGNWLGENDLEEHDSKKPRIDKIPDGGDCGMRIDIINTEEDVNQTNNKTSTSEGLRVNVINLDGLTTDVNTEEDVNQPREWNSTKHQRLEGCK